MSRMVTMVLRLVSLFQVAAQTAGMMGALEVYEAFRKVQPDARLPNIDSLIKQRDDGTLAASMPEAVEKGCQ